MPPRKPAAPSGLSQLKSDLKQGMPAGLYIFYGPEDYLRDYYLEQLKGKVLAEGMESFNLHVFQGKDLTLQELTQAAEAMPMMSERSMVLVYDWDLFKNEERRNGLMALIDDLPEYLCLVFLYDTMEWKGNANTKLGKLIKAKGRIVEFRQQEQSDLNDWLRRRLKQTWGKALATPPAQ
ncbi:MAG: hypothetical protein LIO45_01595 [Clostridiales bacterium]|nr:hypothetical protein [Clostridiales bacterium]